MIPSFIAPSVQVGRDMQCAPNAPEVPTAVLALPVTTLPTRSYQTEFMRLHGPEKAAHLARRALAASRW